MTIDLDGELQRVEKEIHAAEDALMETGFPEAQWLLIRKYVTSAILHNQLNTAKAWQELPEPNINS